MAKHIDQGKIERIRNAAVSRIGRDGIYAFSVADIAADAGLSVGYLYRHYAGKEELINDLLDSNLATFSQMIFGLIEEKKGLRHVVEGVVRHLLELERTDPQKARFVVMLVNDFSIGLKPEITSCIDGLATELFRLMHGDPDIRENLTEEDLYFAIIGVPMQYIVFRYNRMFNVGAKAQADADHIVNIALRVIMKNN